jgi:hypothetical protein
MWQLGVFLLLGVFDCFLCDPKFGEMLNSGYENTDHILDELMKRWEIREYPNFLRSVGMSSSSWELLR